MSGNLKIFQVTEADWWAGYDADSVRAAYRECVGEEADELFAEFGEPQELAESELDKFIVTDVDELGQPKQTAREILKQIENRSDIPCFVASSEY